MNLHLAYIALSTSDPENLSAFFSDTLELTSGSFSHKNKRGIGLDIIEIHFIKSLLYNIVFSRSEHPVAIAHNADIPN